MSAATQVPIGSDLFTWPDAAPRLIGSRCGECTEVAFPVASSCPRCGSDSIETHLLAARGTLWTWTTQDFRPKEPYSGPATDETFEPFALGYVELDGEVRVEGHILADPAEIEIGMELEVAIVPFRHDPDGNEVMAFAFRPPTRSEQL